jgi:DNA-binding transcriptional LysR family regulator
MERMRRLQTLWGWLPTFRAAAEQQSISKAAAQLGVSPSAVSRMIGLLEQDIGQPLFNRVGRGIELNAAGERLLAGARSAMRLVDESLTVLSGKQMVGTVKIASAEPVTRALVLPALDQLRARHPALVPSLVVSREAEVGAALLRGDLDVAFVRHIRTRDQLSVERLGELATGIYAGPSHPLAKAKSVRIAQVLEHDFVACEAELGAQGWWPREYPRKVAVRVEALDIAAELCAKSSVLAALPDVVAERYNQEWNACLHRLPLRASRKVEVFAVWRQQLDLPGRSEAVVEAVSARFAEL